LTENSYEGSFLLLDVKDSLLYLVATPIGNLADITLRAIETLKSCDYILCEDTRHSFILLRHYDISKPLKSYHQFNETARAQEILEDLESGKRIGLISDAGTPGISDPGAILVRLCLERNLPITAIPGPCAAIQALSCSGLPTERFQFWGFLSKKPQALRRELQTILDYPGSTICYESPRRLAETLRCLHTLQPRRHLAVGRELTKKFEEMIRGCAADLLAHWEKVPIKGEVVLVISPSTGEKSLDWMLWSPEEHIQWVQANYTLSRKEAVKLVAELRGLPKRDLYRASLPVQPTPFNHS